MHSVYTSVNSVYIYTISQCIHRKLRVNTIT